MRGLRGGEGRGLRRGGGRLRGGEGRLGRKMVRKGKGRVRGG